MGRGGDWGLREREECWWLGERGLVVKGRGWWMAERKFVVGRKGKLVVKRNAEMGKRSCRTALPMVRGREGERNIKYEIANANVTKENSTEGSD